MDNKFHKDPTPSAEMLERERKALGLRQAGVTYPVIAEQLGYANKGGAYKAVRRAIRRTHQEGATELIALETSRLERLQRAVWAAAMKGDLFAVDRVLRIMERRAKLLGLDQTADVEDRMLAMQVLLQSRQLEVFESALLAMLADLRIDAADPRVRTIIGQRLTEAAGAQKQPLEITQ